MKKLSICMIFFLLSAITIVSAVTPTELRAHTIYVQEYEPNFIDRLYSLIGLQATQFSDGAYVKAGENIRIQTALGIDTDRAAQLGCDAGIGPYLWVEYYAADINNQIESLRYSSTAVQWPYDSSGNPKIIGNFEYYFHTPLAAADSTMSVKVWVNCMNEDISIPGPDRENFQVTAEDTYVRLDYKACYPGEGPDGNVWWYDNENVRQETYDNCGGIEECVQLTAFDAACITPDYCGDGFCNIDETSTTCPSDCPVGPTCTDGIQNQGETGIDCGGPCQACVTPSIYTDVSIGDVDTMYDKVNYVYTDAPLVAVWLENSGSVPYQNVNYEMMIVPRSAASQIASINTQALLNNEVNEWLPCAKQYGTLSCKNDPNCADSVATGHISQIGAGEEGWLNKPGAGSGSDHLGRDHWLNIDGEPGKDYRHLYFPTRASYYETDTATVPTFDDNGEYTILVYLFDYCPQKGPESKIYSVYRKDITASGTPNDNNNGGGTPGDADGDGVSDAIDNCPNTPANTPVDNVGCPTSTGGGGNNSCGDDSFSVSWYTALSQGNWPKDCYPRKAGIPREELDGYVIPYVDAFEADLDQPGDPVCLSSHMCADGSSCVIGSEDGDNTERLVYEAFDESRTPNGVWGIIWKTIGWLNPVDVERDIGLCVEDSLTVREAITKYTSWVEDTFGFSETTSKIVAFAVIPLAAIFLLNFLMTPRRR